MDKNPLPKFDCFNEPATLGPRWTRWLNSFKLYADGTGLIIGANTTDEKKQRRRAMLLHCAGPDVQDIFTTLPDTGTDTDYDAAVQALNTYFVPKVNAAFARQTFHKITQNDVETIQQFSTRLRNAAKDCDFAHDRDNQIRDAILSKCKSSYIKRKLLEEGQDLDLQKTIEIATQCERIESQMRELSVSAPKEASDAGQVNRLYHKENKFKEGRNMKGLLAAVVIRHVTGAGVQVILVGTQRVQQEARRVVSVKVKITSKASVRLNLTVIEVTATNMVAQESINAMR